MSFINQIGKITHREQGTLNLSEHIRLRFKNLDWSQNVIGNNEIRVTYLIWQNPLMAAGNHTFITNMLQQCGLINSFVNFNRYPEIRQSDLIKSRSHYLLLSSEPFPFQHKHITNFTPIFAPHQIKIVNGEFFSWYGSCLLVAPDYFKKLSAELSDNFQKN